MNCNPSPGIRFSLQTRIDEGDSAGGPDVGSGGDTLGGVEIGAGVLEMWCIARDGDREWKLEFVVRYNST